MGMNRVIPPLVPSIDEVRLSNLVKELHEMWRSDPTGVPRRPGEWDHAFILRRLGRSGALTNPERALVARLWGESRRLRGVGGAIGITTSDCLPSHADAVLERFDRSFARFWNGGNR
jgi:hypothetical protein